MILRPEALKSPCKGCMRAGGALKCFSNSCARTSMQCAECIYKIHQSRQTQKRRCSQRVVDFLVSAPSSRSPALLRAEQGISPHTQLCADEIGGLRGERPRTTTHHRFRSRK